MRKINTNDLTADSFSSPKGVFGCVEIQVSEALGRKAESTDLLERHPFDVSIVRVSPGLRNWPYHAHSAQWEFYHVLSGSGKVRHDGGTDDLRAGDAFIFEPNRPHQVINDGKEDLVMYLVADNPIGSATYYPDSNKYSVRVPDRRILRSEHLDYWDGEE
ncbi:MAG TPA: cupin domain-containing protein [Candidatus Baltobacteraceae bacterium]|nr:cupin domain-containing protein [Candidatus Baltobacteraceae bacterium]